MSFKNYITFYMDKDFIKQQGKRTLFLQQKKHEKTELKSSIKRIEDIAKVQAVIRAMLVRKAILKPIVQDASQHIPLVIAKKQQSSDEKFAKIMSNAVYKMPFFFRAFLYINARNITSHRAYLQSLVHCLSVHCQDNYPVIGTILEKKGFALAKLPMLVIFSLTFLRQSADHQFEIFLKAYLRQCEIKHISDKMNIILQDSETARAVIVLILEDRIFMPTQNILINHTALQYPNSFFFLSQQECILLCLRFPYMVTPQFLKANKLSSPKVSAKFLATDNIECALGNYRKSAIILKQALNPHYFNVIRLQFSLFLIGLTLDRYRDAIKGDVYIRFYKKRNLIQTNQNRQQLHDLWSRSVQYTRFVKTIDFQLFAKDLSNIIVSILSEMKNNSVQQTQQLYNLYDHVANFYLILVQILESDFSKIQNLNQKELINLLYKMLTDLNIKNSRLKNNSSGVKTLNLFILILSRQFNLMDDYEFTNQALSYSKQMMYNMIMLTLRVVHELTLEGRHPKNQIIFDTSVKLINNIYAKNFRTKYFNPNIFEGQNLCKQLQNFNIKAGGNNTFLKQLEYIPFVLDLKTRYDMFWQIQTQKRKYTPYNGQVAVRRGHYFQDAFKAMADTTTHGYRFKFVDQFSSMEEAYDAGGPTKQFINRVCNQMFQPKSNFFIETANKDLIPNPFSRRKLRQFQFAGKLIGKAIYHQIAIQYRFSGIFLNTILGRKNTLEDLQFLDKQIYKNLMIIKHNTVQGLDLNFTIVDSFVDSDGIKQSKIIQLREFGSMIPVTQENKMQFIMDFADYKINQQGLQFSKAFRKGFTQLIDHESMKLFNHDELNKIISGMQTDIDFKELRKYVIYSGYKNDDETIESFWVVLNSLEPAQKQQFLMFVTACSRPPLFGFKHLQPPLAIHRSQSTAKLPTSHTCGNRLVLPNYISVELLREKLLLAIEHNTGFGFA